MIQIRNCVTLENKCVITIENCDFIKLFLSAFKLHRERQIFLYLGVCLFYYPNGAINFCFRFIVFYYFFCFDFTSRIPKMFMFCERYFFNGFIMLYFSRVYHFRRCSSFLFLLVRFWNDLVFSVCARAGSCLWSLDRLFGEC